MAVRWRGVLALEDVQTGDGRVFAPGALEWSEIPLPLAWLREEQHGDLMTGAVQVGTIDAISRSGNEIVGEGTIDDGQADGAEVIRRMTEGTAPMGARFGVSIDGDDYEVQVVMTDPAAEEAVLLLASGRGSFDLQAAAGDPDTEDGEVLFEDAADSMLARFTRLRIRGATLCAVPAFDGAFVELAEPTADTAGRAEAFVVTDHAFEDADGDGACDACTSMGDNGECMMVCGQPAEAHQPAEAEEEATVASAAPPAPPRAWFEMPEPDAGSDLLQEQADGSLAVPLTITDDGQVFGHVAYWGQCHTGYLGRCVSPPESETGYSLFHTGEVVTAEGDRVRTGPLTVAADHAPTDRLLTIGEARDHYANSGLGWADVHVVDGQFGIWASGALRPDVTDEQVRVLRALAPSGDWRRGELVAVLAVNTPGFPIARPAMVASLPMPEAPQVELDGGRVVALVAAGIVRRCADCQARASALAAGTTEAFALDPNVSDLLDQMQEFMGVIRAKLDVLDLRTRHLIPDQRANLRQRLRIAE